MRLALGTVEFGMDYGVAASSSRPSVEDIVKILDEAGAAGIDILDTAPAYGEAEDLIGRLAGEESRFKIITKVVQLDSTLGIETLGEQLEAGFERSLERLQRNKVHGLMLHGAGDILGRGGEAVYAGLQTIKASGKVEFIGVCLYDPQEGLRLLDHYPMDIIQLPMNVLDQRFHSSGVLSRMTDTGIEVHVRSAFLQGALLSEASALPSYLAPLVPFLDSCRERARQISLSPLALALGFLRSQPAVSRVLVGVNRIEELRAIVACWRELPDIMPDLSDLACPHEILVSPRRWSELQSGDAA